MSWTESHTSTQQTRNSNNSSHCNHQLQICRHFSSRCCLRIQYSSPPATKTCYRFDEASRTHQLTTLYSASPHL